MEQPAFDPSGLPPAQPAPSAAPGPAPDDALIPAGFWVRAGALVIDSLLLGVLVALIRLALTLSGAPLLVGSLFGLAVPCAYYTYFVANGGKTLGKAAAGVRVIRADGVVLVSYGRALGRYFASYVSMLVAVLGYVMAAFTPEKRAAHDYLAGTRVVYDPGPSRPRQILMVCLGSLCLLVPLAILAAVSASPMMRSVLK